MTVESRLSKIEAVQHFQIAMLGAISKAIPDQDAFKRFARQNLELHHAILCGESVDDVKLAAYEELMHEILGKPLA